MSNNNYILFKGLREETLQEKFVGIVLGACSKYIYYDNPIYKTIHNEYWSDDQLKIVFYDDIIKEIINSVKESERNYVRNILEQVVKYKNVKLLDLNGYDYQTIIALAKSYIVDSYGVVRDMANNKVENIDIPVTRYPLGNHAGLLTQEPLSQINIKDLTTMISKRNNITITLNDIRIERFDNMNLTMVGVKA